MNGREALRLMLDGGPGFCQIALTNACNARCRFCSFPRVPTDDRIMADPERLLAGLGLLRRRGVRYLTLTGGEPLLYPKFLDVLARAQHLGLNTLLVTNGALLTRDLLRHFQATGLGRLLISVDAADPQVHDAHRGLPGLAGHIRDLAPLAAGLGLAPTASVTLSRLTGDLGRIATSLRDQGFVAVTFSYPLTRLDSPYLGCADSPLVDFSPVELAGIFDRLLALKAASPLPILNTRQGLLDLKRRLQGRPTRLPCLAGYKYFFLDWRLDVYRCHVLGHRLGPLEDLPRFAPRRELCAGCFSECYLDASAYQHFAVSLSEARAAWRRGQPLKGLARLLSPVNARSLAALWQGRQWLRQ